MNKQLQIEPIDLQELEAAKGGWRPQKVDGATKAASSRTGSAAKVAAELLMANVRK